MTSSSCAAETNQASNCDGGSNTPAPRMMWKKRANASVSLSLASRKLAGDPHIEDEQSPRLLSELPQPGQKAWPRQDHPHIRGHRLDDDRCHLARMSVQERSDRIEAVVGGYERLRRHRRSDSGAARD